MAIRRVLLWVLFFGVGAGLEAVKPEDEVVGQWVTEKKESRIEIFKEAGKYWGRVVWVQEAVYPEEDPEAGKPVHDRCNPDPALRERPMIGLVMMEGFEYKGENRWSHGKLYNPGNGKLYKAHLSVGKDGSLKVRGYWGISLIGETSVWTRYVAPDQGGK